MGTTTEPKVTTTARERCVEVEWQTGDDQYVVLSCSHSQMSHALIAVLRRERREMSRGLESRIFAPFQDIQRVAVQRVSRYSLPRLQAFAGEQREYVERLREHDSSAFENYFTEGTTA